MDRKPISARSEQYNKYHASELAKKRRAARNKARREALRKGIVKKGDNKEIDHINPNTGGLLRNDGNTRVVHRKTNRSRNNNDWRKTKKRNS